MGSLALRLVATLGLIAAVSCGGAPATSASSPTAAPATAATAAPSAKPTAAAPVKVRAAYQNVTPANLAPFFAKEQGIFLRNGLDVDLPLIDGGSKAMAALLGGSVDIIQIGGTEAMSAAAQGGDVQALALFVPVSPWVLMVPAAYTGPNDLKGKTIGVASKGGSSEVALLQMLERMNLKPADVSIQATGSVANLTAAMLAGQVYAGPGHPPDTARLFAANYKVGFDLAKERVPAVENTTASTKKFVGANREVIQKYVDSLVESIAQMKKDRAATIKVMEKLLQVTDQSALAQTYDYYVTQIFPVYPELTVATWTYGRDDFAKSNPAVKDLDLSKLLDNSFVADAQKRKVGG